MKGLENYDLFVKSLAGVLDTVNGLIQSKEVMVDGRRVELKFVFGSDYKVFQYFLLHVFFLVTSKATPCS